MTVEFFTVAGKIHVRAPFQHKDRCKSIGSGRWQPNQKVWVYPATPIIARNLALAFNGIQVADDEGFRELLGQAGAIERAAEIRSCTKSLTEPPSKTKAWEHQTRAFHFAKDLRAAMLAMEMGCGKSKVAVDLASHHRAEKVLVAAPLSALGVWSREFAKHSERPFDVTVLRKGTVRQRAQQAQTALDLAQAKHRACVIVINHEGLWRAPFNDFAKRMEPDLLIIDESQRAKDPGGKFSNYLASLAPFCARRLALTGTPMPHSPLDIYAQFRFLDPGVYGSSYHRFKQRFAVLGGFEGRVVIDYQNMDTLNALFYQLAYRITKEEALDLPSEVDQVLTFDLCPTARKIYRDLEEVFYARVGEGEITAANALVSLLRLQQLTGGFLERDDGVLEQVDTGKAALLYDTLDDLPRNHPVVVFCRFRRDLDIVAETTTALGLNYGEISGARKDLTPEAKMPEGIDIMGVQIQAGGVGIDLSRADTGIYFSTGFSLGDYLQSRSRLHRPSDEIERRGRDHPVTFLHLIAEETIDWTVHRALLRRDDAIKAILAHEEAA